MTGLAIAWLSAALFAAEPLDVPAVGREVGEILAQDRYYFCAEDNEFVPDLGDHRWCELAAADGFRRCPGYAQVCERAVPGLDWLRGLDEDEDEDEDSEKAEKQPGKANRAAYKEREPLELPNLGVFAKVLMWALLIGGALALAYVIAKNLVRGREDDDEIEVEAEAGPGDSLIAARAAAMRVVETDVQRLLARAEQAAAAGDHEAAIHDVYAALLRRLEGEQLIAVDYWKTNGDYIHDLQPRPPLRDEVREIIREVEQVQFGAAAAEPARYQSVRAKVLAIVGRATLAFALLLGGATNLGCRLFEDAVGGKRRPDSAALAGLGTGPTGKRAVGELLLAHGIKAKHRTRTIAQLTQTEGAIVLLDSVKLLGEDWDTLLTWVEDDGGTLVIATGQEFPRRVGIDYSPGITTTTAIEVFDTYHYAGLDMVAPPGRVLERRATADGYVGELLARPYDSSDRDPYDYDFDVGFDARSYVVHRSLGRGEIIVFAEPHLLTNVGISVAQNAAFVVGLFRSRDIDEVEFINHYSGAEDPFKSMANAKLGALFLQILLFLLLLYLAVGLPFARLRDSSRQRRRSFVEHVRTLGQRYAQARAARHVASLYSAWALDRLRERLQPGAAQGLHPLAQAIAVRTGRDEGQVMQLLIHVHDLREAGPASRGGAADLELMRQLAQLLDEVGGRR
jgi:hypothetical protein